MNTTIYCNAFLCGNIDLKENNIVDNSFCVGWIVLDTVTALLELGLLFEHEYAV